MADSVIAVSKRGKMVAGLPRMRVHRCERVNLREAIDMLLWFVTITSCLSPVCDIKILGT